MSFPTFQNKEQDCYPTFRLTEQRAGLSPTFQLTEHREGFFLMTMYNLGLNVNWTEKLSIRTLFCLAQMYFSMWTYMMYWLLEMEWSIVVDKSGWLLIAKMVVLFQTSWWPSLLNRLCFLQDRLQCKMTCNC